jgi:hypothetical protein
MNVLIADDDRVQVHAEIDGRGKKDEGAGGGVMPSGKSL